VYDYSYKCRTYNGHIPEAKGVSGIMHLNLINFLQEKAVEATKQKKKKGGKNLINYGQIG
jgi:hypothetical protein